MTLTFFMPASEDTPATTEYRGCIAITQCNREVVARFESGGDYAVARIRYSAGIVSYAIHPNAFKALTGLTHPPETWEYFGFKVGDSADVQPEAEPEWKFSALDRRLDRLKAESISEFLDRFMRVALTPGRNAPTTSSWGVRSSGER